MGSAGKYFSRQFRWRMCLLDCHKPEDFYLSCWQRNRSAFPLLLLRTFIFLLCLAIVLASIILTAQSDYLTYWPIYMTHWGIVLNTVAAGLGVLVSARVYMRGGFDSTFGLPWYVKTYWTLYNVAITISFLITVFYWAFLTNVEITDDQETDSIDFAVNYTLDVFIHAINSVSTFLLLISAAHESRLLHCIHPILFAIVYGIFNGIYYVAGGTNGFGQRWIYPMFDWSQPAVSAVGIVMVVVLIILLHVLVVAMAAARNALARWYRGKAQSFSVSD